MSEFDPKSVIVKRKGPAEDTSRVPLMDCPKCGFWTPVDIYCASCGVEMATIKRKRKPSPTSPALVAGSMIALAAAAFIFLRPAPPSDRDDGSAPITSQTGRAAKSASKQNSFMKAMSQLTGTSLDEESADASENLGAAPDATALAEVDLATASAANAQMPPVDSTDPNLEPEAARSALAANATSTETTQEAGTTKTEVPVAFLWVEVSKEWLQVMGASEPGFHAVPELETRLREAEGAYNIISATRHAVREKSDPIDIAGPDRAAMRFDLTTTAESLPASPAATGATAGPASGVATTSGVSLNGVAQTAGRQGADGAIRAPTTVSFTINKGEGTIVNLGKSAARTGAPASTGAEIVVLILPRWGDDRNP